MNVNYPREVGRIIRRCLEKEPARRLQSSLDLRNELEDVRNELTSGGPALPLVGLGPVPHRRRRYRACPASAAPVSIAPPSVMAPAARTDFSDVGDCALSSCCLLRRGRVLAHGTRYHGRPGTGLSLAGNHWRVRESHRRRRAEFRRTDAGRRDRRRSCRNSCSCSRRRSPARGRRPRRPDGVRWSLVRITSLATSCASRLRCPTRRVPCSTRSSPQPARERTPHASSSWHRTACWAQS